MTKSALVTGASRGIGRSIAIQLAEEGYNVAVNFSGNKEKADAVVEEIKAIGVESFAIQANVANGDEVKAMIKAVVSEFGSVDVLVNNAGITRDNLLMRMKEQEWDDVIDTNLKGVFNCIQKVTPQMLRQKSGAIINLSSVSGLMGNVGQANYAASKAGVVGLTKTAARENARKGITCNVVCPGFIETDMTLKLKEVKEGAAWDSMISRVPMGRAGKASDVGKLVTFLASDEAGYITSEVINSSLPVLIDFGAHWCMPCKQLTPVLESLAKDFNGKVKIAKVNVDENTQLTRRYHIMHLPTLMIFKNGQKVEAITGYRNQSQLTELLEKYI